MSAEVRNLIERELGKLRHQVDEHRAVMDRAKRAPPGLIEGVALGTLLHGFCCGVESIMPSIASLTPSGFQKADAWHVDLLASMQSPIHGTPALLSPELGARLAEYLAFRHRFRNLYGFELDWARMSPLIDALDDTLDQFEAATASFLARLPTTS